MARVGGVQQRAEDGHAKDAADLPGGVVDGRDGRFPEPVEVSAYYIVAEALTNAAKHARASAVSVEAEVVGDLLCVTVRDDGIGGADLAGGPTSAA